MQRQLQPYRPAPVGDPDADDGIGSERGEQLRAQGRAVVERAREVNDRLMGRRGRLVDAMRRQRGGQ